MLLPISSPLGMTPSITGPTRWPCWLFGKFYTNFGTAAAAQRLAEAVINDYEPVFNHVQNGTHLHTQQIVGRKGILERLTAFDRRRKEKLLHSAETIKENTQDWSMHKREEVRTKS